MHIDFCCFSMKDCKDDPENYFDFSYAYSKAIIRDASLEQKEIVYELMDSIIESSIIGLTIEGGQERLAEIQAQVIQDGNQQMQTILQSDQ